MVKRVTAAELDDLDLIGSRDARERIKSEVRALNRELDELQRVAVGDAKRAEKAERERCDAQGILSAVSKARDLAESKLAVAVETLRKIDRWEASDALARIEAMK